MHREQVKLVKLNFNELLRPLAVRDGDGKHPSSSVDFPKNKWGVDGGIRGGCWISGCCLVPRWLRAGGEAELRPRILPEPAAVRGQLRVGCVCGECVLKSTPGVGDGPPGIRQRRCPRFLHRLCFTVSFQPLSLPSRLSPCSGSLRSPAGEAASGTGIGAVLPSWGRGPAGTGAASSPEGARRDACACGDTGDLPRQAGAGPEQRDFNFCFLL